MEDKVREKRKRDRSNGGRRRKIGKHEGRVDKDNRDEREG